MALTYGPHLDVPLAEGLTWPAKFIDEFAWERDLPEGHAFGTRSWRKVTKEAVGVVGAIVPWNYPFEVTDQQARPGVWPPGNTGDPEGRSQHAVERHADRSPGGGADGLPPGRAPGRHHLGQLRWPRTW